LKENDCYDVGLHSSFGNHKHCWGSICFLLLKASEKEVIDQVILQMGDWTATTISDYSHKDLPWEVTEEGKTISYNLAFYREAPYSVRIYDESENDD